VLTSEQKLYLFSGVITFLSILCAIFMLAVCAALIAVIRAEDNDDAE